MHLRVWWKDNEADAEEQTGILVGNSDPKNLLIRKDNGEFTVVFSYEILKSEWVNYPELGE